MFRGLDKIKMPLEDTKGIKLICAPTFTADKKALLITNNRACVNVGNISDI